MNDIVSSAYCASPSGLIHTAGFTLILVAQPLAGTVYSVAIGLDPASATDLTLDHPEFT